ncbi:MAG TPA: AAA family ATPase [Candidatus Saccharimonadales bacterium]
MNLSIHPGTAKQLETYKKDLPHALLLTGKTGIGLGTIARSIAGTFYLQGDLRPELLTKTSTIPQIGVDRIRELYTLSRGKQSRSSVVIIDDADTMTESAQNSFLKLLEEPPMNTHFILTTHSPEALLPTVKSRLQTLHIQPISIEQSNELINTLPKLDEVRRRQMLFIASGLPAELVRLGTDDEYFRVRSERIKLAKDLVEGSTSQRLSILLKNPVSRDEAIATIKQIIELLELNPQTSSVMRIKKLLQTLDRLQAGGHVRLQLAAGVL